MAFKRSAVRSRLSPPTTDRKDNALRSCFIFGAEVLPRFLQQLKAHNKAGEAVLAQFINKRHKCISFDLLVLTYFKDCLTLAI